MPPSQLTPPAHPLHTSHPPHPSCTVVDKLLTAPFTAQCLQVCGHSLFILAAESVSGFLFFPLVRIPRAINLTFSNNSFGFVELNCFQFCRFLPLSSVISSLLVSHCSPSGLEKTCGPRVCSHLLSSVSEELLLHPTCFKVLVSTITVENSF